MMNTFNEHLKRVDDAKQQSRTESSRLIESVVNIGAAQRSFIQNQRQLSDIELEITRLKFSNKEIKSTLMKALIERDELITKRTALKTLNERLYNQNQNLHRESDDLLRGDEVDSIVEQFSLNDQMSLLKEIQDTRYKLINCGFPLSYFA